MIDYDKTTIKTLKTDLKKRGVESTSLNNLKKGELVEIHKDVLEKEIEEMVDDISSLEDAFQEDSVMDNDSDVDDDRPSFTSPEWHSYVMGFFEPNELIEGNPITAGLRRVAELILGDVVESGPTEVIAPTNDDGPGRATVVYRVTFNWLNTGELRSYSDTADVWHGNTDDLFCAHPVATASTRAEGRALRKALKLRVLAAEELSKKDIVSIVQKATSKITDGDWNPEEKISSQQIGFIDNKCKQLDISVFDFINIGKNSYDRIDVINKITASEMIKQLNKYQNGDLEKPQEISGYDSEWRKR